MNRQSGVIRKMRIKNIEISMRLRRGCHSNKIAITCLAAILCIPLIPGNLFGKNFSVKFSLAHGFDDNIYRVNQGSMARKSSFVTQLEPSLHWKGTSGLSIHYNPQITRFHSESPENVIRHHFGFEHVGAVDSGIRWQLSSNSIRVQGPSESVMFDQGRNAFSTVHARERRNQWQNRSRLVIHIPVYSFEIIPDLNLIYYDLDSVRKPGLAGYDNYINRYDLRTGLRLEKDLNPEHRFGLAAYSGYQHQGLQGERATSRSNHYQRMLLSWRGHALEKIRFNFSAGPSLHAYNHGPGPMKITQWYVDASATYQIGTNNNLGFRWRQSNGVASTGRLSNHVKSYALTYSHAVHANWDVKLEGLARALIYHGVTVKDWVYSAIFQIDYKAGEAVRLSFNIEHNQGRDEALSRPGREFHRMWVNVKGSWIW